MKQGKFQAGRKPEGAEKTGERRRPDWLLILVPILVIAALAAIVFLNAGSGNVEETLDEGMSKSDTLNLYRWMAGVLEQHDMVLTLKADDPELEIPPITLTVPPAMSRVQVDLAGLEADLDRGVGRVGFLRYSVDPKQYISLDRAALRRLAEQTEGIQRRDFQESFAVLDSHSIGEDEVHELVVNVGSKGRAVSAEAIYEALLEAYYRAELSPVLSYEARDPKPLDADALWKEFCVPPVDAVLNETDFSITPDIPGYGFDKAELEALLPMADEGTAYRLLLRPVQAERTAAVVEASLYDETLAEAHTPHSWINDRTVNLKLACEAINGTVVMPGEIFSFNETVGERTAAKGYREATVYGAGGASVPELGGGVCQVASSIYYAVLQADLETVERSSHMYLVTYVPQGMDAAIYWGMLDYKFRNSSPYPLKIEADVSDGRVHIYLKGTEWKDYRVKLSYQILEEVPYETTYQYVYDGSYAPGDTIVSPYTGYLISTYRTVLDDEGNAVETTKISTSRYRKRDKVVAALPPTPTPTAPTTPTEPGGAENG
ncbi:MAG: VanW family protein [Oscillospiraceae bacterium]|nr:VanW family protein [Oscillospiraceae bacterium]